MNRIDLLGDGIGWVLEFIPCYSNNYLKIFLNIKKDIQFLYSVIKDA